MTKAEWDALRKVYNAIREARQVEDPHGASEWLFWKDVHEFETKIWNAIGCPKR